MPGKGQRRQSTLLYCDTGQTTQQPVKYGKFVQVNQVPHAPLGQLKLQLCEDVPHA